MQFVPLLVIFNAFLVTKPSNKNKVQFSKENAVVILLPTSKKTLATVLKKLALAQQIIRGEK